MKQMTDGGIPSFISDGSPKRAIQSYRHNYNSKACKTSKKNNTAKHASCSIVAMDITSIQSPEHRAVYQIDKIDKTEMKRDSSRNTDKNNTPRKHEANEKANTPKKREIVKKNLIFQENENFKTLIDKIQNISYIKYGEEKTNKLIKKMITFGNPMDVFFDIEILKSIFQEEYIEAKNYFAKLTCSSPLNIN